MAFGDNYFFTLRFCGMWD